MTIPFFYCVGTSYATAEMARASDLEYVEPPADTAITVAGLNGATARWNGTVPQDPFPNLLDRSIFTPKKIFYPASETSINGQLVVSTMGQSIDTGIANVAKAITDLPSGSPFMLGGQSQGAAVMSSILLQMKTGGALESYASRFKGCVNFGNPRRATDYRGSVGGTWSGAFDVPGSTTGGHGAFPATGPYRRLTAAECDPLKWIDFAAPDDIFTSVGDSPQGVLWTAGTNIYTGAASLLDWAAQVLLAGPTVLASIAVLNFASALTSFTDAAGRTISLGGRGHVSYAFSPPPGNPDGLLTAYQIGLKFLLARANEIATAPIFVPPTTTAGWSTTLIPPAA